MIRNNFIKQKGITLVSLSITVVVILILTGTVIYNTKDKLVIEKLQNMQNDISNLREKVNLYYAQYGKIPANTNIEYTNIGKLKEANIISNATDTGKFYVIDLKALENLTLNYGEDYKNIKEDSTQSYINTLEDIYIINETSHNVFYVKGILANETWYYTDYTEEGKDKQKVDLRYVENVKIPDGYSYISGTKESGIIIQNDNNPSERYKWVVVKEKIGEIPNGIVISEAEKSKFIESTNAYKGYYQNISGTSVIYFDLENKWSPVYDVNGTYKDKNGDTAIIPKGFQVSTAQDKNTIDNGLVVRNATTDDRYVWIEVPRTIYITATSNTDYAKIENDLQTYASDYRDSNYEDIWYSKEQHGFATAQAYNDLKNKMLKSVYDNGGFLVSQYEMGTNTQRISGEDSLTTPVSIEGAYPYNYVTCTQAQQLANSLSTTNYTSSLMFGIQWDLILKYIETKGAKTQEEIKTNSIAWGNYSDATFDITRGKYTTTPDTANPYTEVGGIYTKPELTNVLLTTGTTKRNSALNIYDLVGNVFEWTLEYSSYLNVDAVYRGGLYSATGIKIPAYYRNYKFTTSVSDKVGFRTALYI